MRQYNADQAQRFIADLRQTRALFDDHARSLTAQQAAWSPDDKTWSMVQLLAHIRACQDVWASTITYMLTTDQTTLPAIHPTAWENALHYTDQPFHEALTAFTVTRDTLLHRLGALDEADWQRSATVGARPQTVYSQIRRMALHERNSHHDQIIATARICHLSS